MTYIFQFLLWTLMLYWLHRLVHQIPPLRRIHGDHHRCVALDTHLGRWHPYNLVLYSDTWGSTADMWITEVIPTVIFAWLFDAWWILAAYYLWAAFLQEPLEHNDRINFYPWTAGRWHRLHHLNPRCNFGLFLPIWDIIFKTEKRK